jgi:Protein of unknown function (DUF3617)
MEASMEAMKNVSIGKDGNTAVKVCMTKEMIDARQFNNQNTKCTHNLGPLSGNTQKYSFSCTEPLSSGEGVIVFQSNTSYTSTIKIKSTQNGKSEEVTIESSGKFLDANCGSVKPLATTAK